MLRRRTLTLLVPRRPVPAIARRPIGALAVLRTPRPTAALERPVALPWTSFALAFVPPPARAALLALIAAPLEGAILRTALGATLTLATTSLEPPRPSFPARPAATLPRTRRTVVIGTAFTTLATPTRGAIVPTLPTRTGEPVVATLATLTREATLFALTALAGKAVVLTLTTRTREAIVATLATLTREAIVPTLTPRTRETAFLALTARP